MASRLDQITADYSGWHFANDNPARSLNPPANERLTEIQVPALIILGELDLPFYNYLIADRLTEEIAHSQKVIMPQVGHMANMEDPERFNKIVLAFLESFSQ